MTNEELELLNEERMVARMKKKGSIPGVESITQDVDFCILYDVFKLGDKQKTEAKHKFRRDAYTLNELKQKRIHLLKHVNLIYQKTDMLPTGNDRNYVQNAFEQVKTTDAAIKKIDPLYNPDWKGLIDPIV